MNQWAWAKAVLPRDRLVSYRARLAELLEEPEPADEMGRGFRLGSINHCTEMIRHLSANLERSKSKPGGK